MAFLIKQSVLMKCECTMLKTFCMTPLSSLCALYTHRKNDVDIRNIISMIVSVYILTQIRYQVHCQIILYTALLLTFKLLFCSRSTTIYNHRKARVASKGKYKFFSHNSHALPVLSLRLKE